MLSFTSDYQEGAHPEIMKRLTETNRIKSAGYGTDGYCASAREKIRAACNCPDAEVHFLIGGTQANATVIDALLKSYQGVVAPASGHISVHEAGAIEYGGHKVLDIPHTYGKITAGQISKLCEEYWQDDNHEHMVMPGMVYLSQPTEYGTLYALSELKEISEVCKKYQLRLYIDGARLAYALASNGNDVTLPDLARLCDVFYIGGTKCGALFGEAVVIPKPDLLPHFFTIMKQHGALLAKGRLLGLQFDVLFSDGLYMEIGKPAIKAADSLRSIFMEAGYHIAFDSPTNQIFVLLDNEELSQLSKKVAFSFWEKYDETHSIVRFASSWATQEEEVRQLQEALNKKGV